MRLCINIDHLATLRNARGGFVPDPIDGALIAERAGAAGVVCHLREDRRHIRDHDVVRLRNAITTKLDLEMAATPEIIAIALRIKPELVTLVPERREELTTEGGLDVVRLRVSLRRAIQQFHEKGIEVSLFIDPRKDQMDASNEIGADMVELHTGEYANAAKLSAQKKHLTDIRKMATYGKGIGLGVNAGHGLDYTNIKPIAAVSAIDEVSIGHAVVVRAMFVGFERAVREMVRLVRSR